MTDYSELTAVYAVLRANYERESVLDRAFMRKTADLVQQHTRSGKIEPPQKMYDLDAKTLEKISGGDQPDTVKVFNLVRAFGDLSEDKGQYEPYLISIGERAKEIADRFEQRQQTTQQTLFDLDKLIADLKDAESDKKATDLTPEAFAVFWYLKRQGVTSAQKVAHDAGATLEQYPHWSSSSHQEQEVRKGLYKSLIDAGVEQVVEITQAIMRLLGRKKS